MNIARRIVMVLAGVVVIALAIELAAPKAVHALVSTLVTVVNPSSNPVQVREVNNKVDELFAIALLSYNSAPADASSRAYIESLFGDSLPADSGVGFTVADTDAAGNPVEALVINYVSGVCVTSTTTPSAAGLMRQSTVNPINGQSQIVNLFALSPDNGPSSSLSTISQAVNIVLPSNSTVSVFDPGALCYLTINGYYVAQTSKPL
jgi:hypothetical protein